MTDGSDWPILKGLSSRKKMSLFIILIDALYLLELAVQKNFFLKIIYPKKLKNRESFLFKKLKHRGILIPHFSILAIYVTNSSARAS